MAEKNFKRQKLRLCFSFSLSDHNDDDDDGAAKKESFHFLFSTHPMLSRIPPQVNSFSISFSFSLSHHFVFLLQSAASLLAIVSIVNMSTVVHVPFSCYILILRPAAKRESTRVFFVYAVSSSSAYQPTPFTANDREHTHRKQQPSTKEDAIWGVEYIKNFSV